MKYYKDLENKLHALDSSEFEYLLSATCVAITEEEYEAIRKAQQTLTLAEIKNAQIELIDAAYNAAITANIDYLGSTFQADFPTHDNIKSVLSCGTVPPNFAWYDINNNPIHMTFAELQGFSQALVFRGFAAFTRKQELKVQVSMLTNPEAIKAIIW